MLLIRFPNFCYNPLFAQNAFYDFVHYFEVLMFCEKFCELCEKSGYSPNAAAAKLGFSNATCTKWKKGSVPGGVSLAKISEFFWIGVDELLGTKKSLCRSTIRQRRLWLRRFRK